MRILPVAMAAMAALSAWACTQESAPAPPRYPRLVQVATPAQALDRMLASSPSVLAVGEYHQTEATASVHSAIERFSRQMLPGLKGRGSDLVLETWMVQGGCGEAEQKATAEIEKTTQRPEATEDELVGLLKRAKALGLRPHILELSCEDYEHIQPDGEMDYHRVLVLTRDKLRDKTSAVLADRTKQGRAPLVVVYGGAVHNDLVPPAEDAEFCYAPAVDRATGGKLVEVDLLVPAFVDEDAIEASDWYPLYEQAVASGRFALIERGPRSFALVFPD